jgi:UDP-glucose 4-epimerase
MSAGRVVVTGIASSLGAPLLRRLAEERGGDAVLAVDVAAPPEELGVRHQLVDLAAPAADQSLLEVFREQGVDAVVHCAFLTKPRRDAAFVHELESIGTLNLLAACAAGGVSRVVLRSFTAVYGPSGRHPNFLTEDRPLQADADLAWVREKVEAEQHAAAFARRYPGMRVTVLRFAPLFGPGVRTFYTRLFDNRVVPVLMGYDPLVQLLHPDDALDAALRAIEDAPGGALNVVPSRPIPLLTALHLAHKIPVAVPHPVAEAAADLLWSAGLAEAPGGFVGYARYPCVGDPDKARRVLGFAARWSSRDALFAYLRDRYADPAFRDVPVPA